MHLCDFTALPVGLMLFFSILFWTVLAAPPVFPLALTGIDHDAELPCVAVARHAVGTTEARNPRAASDMRRAPRRFSAPETEKISVARSGSAGIGTTAPQAPLDVESTQTYAGFFNNTNTGSGFEVGVSGTCYGSSCYAGYFRGEVGGAGGVYGIAGGSSTTFGVGGSTSGTSGSYGVYGVASGASNTSYAGYFTNTATSGANYGVYGTDASASGYGGYFTNSNGGWALSATGTSYFNGNVGIVSAKPKSRRAQATAALRDEGRKIVTRFL